MRIRSMIVNGGVSRGPALGAALLIFVCVPCIARQNNGAVISTSQAPKGTFASDIRQSQPLGTVAHQQQEQKSSNSSKHHVITDEDMPSHPAPALAADLKGHVPKTKSPKPELTNETVE